MRDMKRKNVNRIPLALLALLTLLVPSLALAETGATVSSTPGEIQMGAQFDGTSLTIQGTAPARSDVIVQFTGARKEIHMREKGKVFGLLWMNVGKVTLKNVPKVCIINSSRSFSELGKVADPYRLEGVMGSIEVEQDGQGGNVDVIKELLRLKKKEKLYHEAEDGVKLGPDTGGSRTFSATAKVPSSLDPGKYLVEAFALKDGAVVARASTTVQAKLIGFPEWLSKLAFGRSLLYGVLATVIALVSGLGIGLVFQSKGAH